MLTFIPIRHRRADEDDSLGKKIEGIRDGRPYEKGATIVSGVMLPAIRWKDTGKVEIEDSAPPITADYEFISGAQYASDFYARYDVRWKSRAAEWRSRLRLTAILLSRLIGTKAKSIFASGREPHRCPRCRRDGTTPHPSVHCTMCSLLSLWRA